MAVRKLTNQRSFSPAFEKLSRTEQVLLLLSTHEALNKFFQSRDCRLDLPSGFTPKPILLFHLAYQMALLVTMPPFLKVFTSSSSSSSSHESEQVAATPTMQLILRSLFYAASSTTRLVSSYRESYTLRQANPVIIHHLLSSSIVHLMNSTAKSLPLKRRGTRLLRQSLVLFSELAEQWPTRVCKSIDMIQVLAHRWGCSSSLLIPPQPSLTSSGSESAERPTSHEMGMRGGIATAITTSTTAVTNADGNSFETNNVLYPQNNAEAFSPEFGVPDLQSFANFEFCPPPDAEEPLDIFKAFEELNNSQDFGWLFGL